MFEKPLVLSKYVKYVKNKRRGQLQRGAPIYYLAKSHPPPKKKLHENERNYTERECASLAPLLDPPMKMATVGLVSGSFIVAVGYRVQHDTANRGLWSMSGCGLPPQNQPGRAVQDGRGLRCHR